MIEELEIRVNRNRDLEISWGKKLKNAKEDYYNYKKLIESLESKDKEEDK